MMFWTIPIPLDNSHLDIHNTTSNDLLPPELPNLAQNSSNGSVDIVLSLVDTTYSSDTTSITHVST